MHATNFDPASGVAVAATGHLAEISGRTAATELVNRTAINLVPSENRMSPAAHALLGSDYSNRYCFNERLTAGQWEFRGGEAIAELEKAGRESFSRLLHTAPEWVNLRPISGLNAMMIAVAALGGAPGSMVVSISQTSGGHYATGALVSRFGHRWRPVDAVDGRIDLGQLEQALATGTVALVYADMQNSRHVLDVGAVAELVDRYPPARLHIDCSHTLGLVLGSAHPNPLDYGAGSISSSLHKTFPGPHRGLLATRDETTHALLREAQFMMVSSHHFATALAAARTALEFETYGKGYATAVIANARVLAAALVERGFDVAGAASGYTDTHQVWVRLQDPFGVSDRLARWGIRVNIQRDLPGCPGPMFRLGTAEPTLLGATAIDMRDLAAVIAMARDEDTSQAAALVGELRGRIGQRPWWLLAAAPEGAWL
ncbi:aminotransferase class I/II-fold pyridoxal phosphate-dependent enzyme [Nocardia sp. CNY236]|uniref:aminotransferase class I/II-fold pyridoxal phosphate-dependent enzyme n=1 Tax=Nocardia sp. CNY236 TaxID=1169152 RepID=UPI00041EC89D|nr:aminotransferase class I/II-fold pyridoxal phosphate-dependent enzyme [Nocardia sp. CNY236]